MSNFLRALSLYVITKWVCKYRSLILIVFKNKIYQYTIYLFNYVMGFFTMYSSIAKGVPVSVFSFFYFSYISIFDFLDIKRAHDLEVNISADP